MLTRSLARARVCLEKGLIKQARALDDNEPAVPRSIRGEVEQTLDALDALALGRLVHMGPRGIRLSVGVWERDVGAVKGYEQIGGVPYLGKSVDDGGLAVAWVVGGLSAGSVLWTRRRRDSWGKQNKKKKKGEAHIRASQKNFSCATA